MNFFKWLWYVRLNDVEKLIILVGLILIYLGILIFNYGFLTGYLLFVITLVVGFSIFAIYKLIGFVISLKKEYKWYVDNERDEIINKLAGR